MEFNWIGAALAIGGPAAILAAGWATAKAARKYPRNLLVYLPVLALFVILATAVIRISSPTSAEAITSTYDTQPVVVEPEIKLQTKTIHSNEDNSEQINAILNKD